MIKVGFQGKRGSFSESAAEELMKEFGIKEYELIPLVNSKSVIGELACNDIDYGVIAIKNTLGGIVQESRDALLGGKFVKLKTHVKQIRHSLFVKTNEIKIHEIKAVISHEQALKQCEHNLKIIMPEVKLIPAEDTAIAAENLRDGVYDQTVAILCSKMAGIQNNLHMLREQVQDFQDNRTEFALIVERRNRDVLSETNAPFWEKLAYRAVGEHGIGWTTKITVVVTVMIISFVRDSLGMSSVEAALRLGIPFSAIFLFLTSYRFANKLNHRRVTGYWEYTVSPDQGKPLVAQKPDKKRVVKLYEENGEIKMRGWLCEEPTKLLYYTTTVLISSMRKKSGSLAYWYVNTYNPPVGGESLNGVVSLEWHQNVPWEKVTKMQGWYLGRATNDVGVINYTRISKEDFQKLTGEY